MPEDTSCLETFTPISCPVLNLPVQDKLAMKINLQEEEETVQPYHRKPSHCDSPIFKQSVLFRASPLEPAEDGPVIRKDGPLCSLPSGR